MLDRPGIPKSEEAVTVDWMQRALVAGGTCDVLALKDMSVEQIGTRSGFVGTLLRCHLTYHEDTSTGPRSVIVKLPSKNAKARRVSRTLSLYKREYDFYSALGRTLRSHRRRCCTANSTSEAASSSWCLKT